MVTRYLEPRSGPQLDPMKLMADVMRHFYARQNLGKAVVLTDDPAGLLLAGRKQWLKLSRTLQQRRSAATSAVEILKFTYNIAQMQQMRFVDKAPHEQPEANMFFVRPEDVRALPSDCLSVYLAVKLADGTLPRLVDQLPASGLLVGYHAQPGSVGLGLKPKLELERNVAAHWQKVETFLTSYGVDVHDLDKAHTNLEVLDDAVDALLDAEIEFLTLANQFQRALNLARPLKTVTKSDRNRYDTFLMLAHYVQTLIPSGFSAQFLSTYADDMFFLNDNRFPYETLTETVARHQRAGRFNLARALMRRQSVAPMQHTMAA